LELTVQIDHVAYPCNDPRKTDQFYGTVLGFKLVQAYAGRSLLLIYALPDGGSLAFTASSHALIQPQSPADWECRHVGLTVDTREEFDHWLNRLNAFGVRHKVVADERIYFEDPDGFVLELEVASPLTINEAADDVLTHWVSQFDS
jgi:catechol 2,3-dioxygenase-like lactoylglutathione lyase family enzyme